MIDLLIKVYRFLFARKIFYKFNKLLYRLSLSGLGVLNYENDVVSGELAMVKRLLANSKTSDVVIDVGANRGNYSKLVTKFNPNLKIFAFEPHPRTFIFLRENIQNFAECFNVAIGDKSGYLNLYDYKHGDGSSHASLYKDVIEDIHRKESVAHNVKLITLDSFILEHKIENVALLKIDTEGNELAVINGAIESINNGIIKIIHFEFNEMNVISRTFFKDIWDLLPFYRFFRLLPHDMIEIKSYSPLFCEIFAYQNIVAIKKNLCK